MKRLLIICIAIAAPAMMIAQDGIDKYFSSQLNSDDYTKISVSSKMFELFTHIEGESAEEEDILEAISKLDGLRMIVNDSDDDCQGLYNSAIKKPGKEYEILMTMDDDDEDISFYITEKSGVISELMMIGHSVSEFFVLSLVGDIDLKQINSLGRSLQIDGMQHLEKIEEK